MVHTKYFQHSIWKGFSPKAELDSAAVSIFVVILVELTNIVFVNSTNIYIEYCFENISSTR